MYPEVFSPDRVTHPKGGEINTSTINLHLGTVKGILARFAVDCEAICEIPGKGTKAENSEETGVMEEYRGDFDIRQERLPR